MKQNNYVIIDPNDMNVLGSTKTEVIIRGYTSSNDDVCVLRVNRQVFLKSLDEWLDCWSEDFKNTGNNDNEYEIHFERLEQLPFHSRISERVSVDGEWSEWSDIDTYSSDIFTIKRKK